MGPTEWALFALAVILPPVAWVIGHFQAESKYQWMLDALRWEVSEAKEELRQAENRKQAMEGVEMSLRNVAETLQFQRKSIDALDFNVGQLTLRMVKDQVRVKGLQHGEEMTPEEITSGVRRRIEPLPQPTEPPTEGFTIDGKTVDPRQGLQRTIASAQPT